MEDVFVKENTSAINDIFRREVMLLRQLWMLIKYKCDAKENSLLGLDRIRFVRALERKYFSLMKKHFITLNRLVENLSDTMYLEYKEYMRSQLCELMISDDAPMNKQINDKPFGYAGDYLVANYFYENGYSGVTLWGMLMDRFTVQSPFATAHRNRRSYLVRYINMILKKNKVRPLRITSLACGPAQEVFDILDNKNDDVMFTLIDGEYRAINFIKDKILDCGILSNKVKVYKENILNLLRRNSSVVLPAQDFIYCAGFFDYVKDVTVRKCIKYMFDCLKPGGYLLVLNVGKEDEKDVCLRMLADWNLYHRDLKELEALSDSILPIKYRKTWADKETKRNNYLLIVKEE